MADERELAFRLDMNTGDASEKMDEAKQKQKELADETKKTGEALDKVGVNMAGIGTRARSAFSTASGNAKSFGTTARSALLDSIKQGDSLGKTLKAGVGAGFLWVRDRAKGFGAAGASVAKDIGNAFLHPVQTIKANLGHALLDAQKETDTLGKKSKKTGDDLEKMGSRGKKSGDSLIDTLKKVAAAALAIGAVTAGINMLEDFGTAAVNAAAKSEETQSKFETVFKDQADRSQEWINNFSSAAKRSKGEIQGFVADAQSILTGVGMDVKPAADMSAAITSLSYDLASFHNLSDQDAFDKLRSGLTGEAQGLKTMGIVLNEAALKQSMFNMGLKGNFNDLDEAAKMQVRFNAILAQTGDAQTDVTRTTDSYTNGLKGIQGMWSDFLSDAGAKFIPTLMTLFNAILDAWPTIEPMLMGLVDILANGLAECMPILIELGKKLLPILVDVVGKLFDAILPILPVIMDLVAVLLPPLAELFSMLVTTILPPLTDIFMVLVNDVLRPLLPIFMELISALLPPFVQLLGMIAPVLQMLAPFLSMLAQMLVPIAQVVGQFISSLLPPLMEILNVIFVSILQPLMPILQMLIQALLPPLAQLLGLIAPILQLIAPILEAISPVISFIGDVLGFIVGIIAKIIEWVAGGIGKVVDFFTSLFGGAKKAKEETGGLADNMKEVTKATDNYKPPEITAPTMGPIQIEPIVMPPIEPYAPPPIPAPDVSAYTGGVTTAVNTLPTANQQAMTKVQTDTGKHMDAIGATATDTYTEMETTAVRTWDAMADAAERGVTAIVAQFKKLGTAAASVGNITIGATGVKTEPVPHYAGGTRNHPGGPAIINDGDGGEMVVLPDGSEVIPADQTDRLISRSSSRTVISQPIFNVNITGNPTDEQKRETEEWLLSVARKEREEATRAEQAEIRIQEAYA